VYFDLRLTVTNKNTALNMVRKHSLAVTRFHLSQNMPSKAIFVASLHVFILLFEVSAARVRWPHDTKDSLIASVE